MHDYQPRSRRTPTAWPGHGQGTKCPFVRSVRGTRYAKARQSGRTGHCPGLSGQQKCIGRTTPIGGDDPATVLGAIRRGDPCMHQVRAVHADILLVKEGHRPMHQKQLYVVASRKPE
jgi:hypothetical protein